MHAWMPVLLSHSKQRHHLKPQAPHPDAYTDPILCPEFLLSRYVKRAHGSSNSGSSVSLDSEHARHAWVLEKENPRSDWSSSYGSFSSSYASSYTSSYMSGSESEAEASKAKGRRGPAQQKGQPKEEQAEQAEDEGQAKRASRKRS
jgi:hypothetical protein